MELQSSRDPLPEASASVAKTPKRIREGPAGSDPQGWSHRAGWAARGRTGHSLDVGGGGGGVWGIRMGNQRGFSPGAGASLHGHSGRWEGRAPRPPTCGLWRSCHRAQSKSRSQNTTSQRPREPEAGQAREGAWVSQVRLCWAPRSGAAGSPGPCSPRCHGARGSTVGSCLRPSHHPGSTHPLCGGTKRHTVPLPALVSCKHVSGEHAELRTGGRASGDSAASGSDTGCQGSAPTAASRARLGSPGPVQDASGDLITPLCS